MNAIGVKRFIIIFLVYTLPAQAQTVLFSGRVKDAQDRPLAAASIQLTDRKKVTTTAADGSFSFLIAPGEVSVIVSYTGFTPLFQKITLTGDLSLDFVLLAKVEELKEVVVESGRFRQSDQLQTTRMSSVTLTKEEVNSIPMLGGEADVIKMIQLLPGVVRGVEGGTDLFVRGGAADQNLVLLDGAPMYNTGHLLGFMSVFNTDVLESVESMTGAFPAEYGGRLSSILDVKTRSGIMAAPAVSGNIGLISSRLMVETPLVKNKLSISLAGRRTYIDKVLKTIGQDVPYYFYDFNGKINYAASKRDLFELSVYAGKDILSYHRANTDTTRSRNFTSNFDIANSAQILKWKRSLNRNWNSDLSLIHNKFDYTITSIFGSNRLFTSSRIEDLAMKWIASSDSAFRFSFAGGAEVARHRVSPNVINTSGGIAQLLESGSTQGRTLTETSVFGQTGYDISRLLRASAGLRISSAAVTGRFYVNPEPRLALRYTLSPKTSVKASYSRMAQYLQRVSSSAVAFPTDIWFPVTQDVLPQISNQVSLALQHHFEREHLFLSVETYYKKMSNLIGFQEGTNLFLNTNFEERLIQGKGRSYGLEFLLKKESGKLTGWISYTLSKTERQYSQINSGDWFYARYDRRHNAAVVMSYKVAPRWSVSAVWEFISGSRFTPIIGQYVVPSPTLTGLDLIPVYAKTNSIRLADTHRLDLGIKFRSRPGRRFQSEWFAGVYNVYNRASPIGINIVSDGNGGYKYEQPGLFGLLPFVSYGFKF